MQRDELSGFNEATSAIRFESRKRKGPFKGAFSIN